MLSFSFMVVILILLLSYPSTANCRSTQGSIKSARKTPRKKAAKKVDGVWDSSTNSPPAVTKGSSHDFIRRNQRGVHRDKCSWEFQARSSKDHAHCPPFTEKGTEMEIHRPIAEPVASHDFIRRLPKGYFGYGELTPFRLLFIVIMISITATISIIKGRVPAARGRRIRPRRRRRQRQRQQMPALEHPLEVISDADILATFQELIHRADASAFAGGDGSLSIDIMVALQTFLTTRNNRVLRRALDNFVQYHPPAA
jgi:hypothetical protein